MLIDYKHKTIQFSHLGEQIQLQGVVDNTNACTPISAHKLRGLLKVGASHCVQMIVPSLFTINDGKTEQVQSDTEEELPTAVVELLSEYDHLFSEV